MGTIDTYTAAAAFGHSADVNRGYYTDVTDISGFTSVMKRN